ncbi:hypothetical protein [Thalassotalea fusca]
MSEQSLKAEQSLIMNVKHFLSFCCEDNFEQAGIALTQFHSVVQSEEILSLFANVQEGAPLIQGDASTYFTGAIDGLSEIDQQAMINDSKRVAHLFDQSQPLLLVNIMKESKNPPFAIRICHGVGVVYLPYRTVQRNEVVHEITHCIVTSGHHFLDEALAYYAEVKLEQSHLPRISYVSLDYCLQVRHIETLNGMDNQDVLNIYSHGVELANLLLNQISPGELIDIYRQIPLLIATKKLEPQLQALVGHQWHKLASCDETAITQPDHASVNDDAESLSHSLNKAYFSGDLAQVGQLLEQLFPFKESNDRYVIMAIIRGLFSALCYGDNDDPSTALTFQTLCNRIQQQCPNTPESYVCTILINCLKMQHAKSYLEIQELAIEVGEIFDKGLSAFPENGELNLMKGKSLFDTPEAQGGDKTLARHYFEQATKDPFYGTQIMQLVANT